MVMMTLFGVLGCWRIERDLLIENILHHAAMLRQFCLYIIKLYNVITLIEFMILKNNVLFHIMYIILGIYLCTYFTYTNFTMTGSL